MKRIRRHNFFLKRDTIDYHIKNLKKQNKPKPLLECVNLHEELIPYANDYKINVFEIS